MHLAAALVTCLLLVNLAQAQTPDPGQELRRQQERENVQRQLLTPEPDVRLPATGKLEQRTLPAETPCFKIEQVVFDGDRVVNADLLLHSLAGKNGADSPIGGCLGTQGINLLLERAQDALITAGYVTSRVLARPQDLNSGVLHLTVLAGRINALRFAVPEDGRGTVWNALPATTGDILNLRDLEQGLENFRRLPSAQADFKIEPTPGGKPGMSDVVISYAQPQPFRLTLTADDGGSRATGKYQGSLTFSYDNWLLLNDMFYATYNQDLGGGYAGPKGTRGNLVHYSIPYGYWQLGISLSNSHYYQTVAGLNQNYVYRGDSDNTEIRLKRLIQRDAASKTAAYIAGFMRRSRNYIDDTEIEVQRRNLGGWEAGMEYKRYIGNATLEGGLRYKRGTGAFRSLPSPEENFGEGTSRFAIYNADAMLNLPFKWLTADWRYNLAWRYQRNGTPLTPQDRFAIGGRYTVRGFDGETTLAAERGWLVRNELAVALGGSGQEMFFGVDHGEVGGGSVAGLLGRRLTGSVAGLRGTLLKHVSYEIFAGTPLKKPERFRTAGSVAGFNLVISI